MSTTNPGDASGVVKPEPASATPRFLPLSLRANLSWSLVGNAGFAACQWGAMIALTKLVSPEMVGRFSYGVSVAAPVIMLSNLAVRQMLAADARRRHPFGDCLGLRLLTAPAAVLAVCAVALGRNLPPASAWVMVAVGVAKGFESLSDVIYGLLQQRERMDRAARSMIARGAAGLPALVLAVWVTGDVLWGVGAMAAAWGAVLLLYDLANARSVAGSIRPAFHPGPLRALAWRGLPLGLAAMLVNLNTNVPRYFIEGALGEAQLGVFSALAYVIVIGSIVMNAFGQGAVHRLARYHETSDRRRYLGLMGRLSALAAAAGAGGVAVAAVAGGPVLELLYSAEYAAQSDLLVWLMLSGGLMYIETFLGYGMTACQQFRIQPFVYCVGVGVLAGLCSWLVPAYGLLGAAWAILGAGAFRIVAILLVQLRALSAMGPSGRHRGDTE